jgi:WD40 repeat protein
VVFPGHTRDAKSIAISADGRWMVSGSVDGNAFVWDYRGGTLVANANYFPARLHTGTVNDVAISVDGKRFLTAGGDTKAVLWEFEPGGRPYPRDLLVGHKKPINTAALAPNGRYAATAGQDHMVLLWDIAKSNPNESVKVLEGHRGEITDLVFSTDGEWLFSSSTDKSVRAWRAEANWAGTELIGHADEVVRLALSRDDRFLISADIKGQVRTWDLKAPLGQPKQQYGPHEREIWALVFNKDGDLMLSGSADRKARIWQVGANGLVDETVPLRGHTDTINTGAFSPDSHWVATGSRDGTIRLWDKTSAHPDENARTFEMLESNGVEWLLFAPDGKRLYAGNGDGSVHVWYPEPLEGRDDHQILQGHEKKVSAMVMPQHGQFLLTASFDGTARVWPMLPTEMIQLACYTAGRNPTEAEWEKWLPGQQYHAICSQMG